MIYVDIRVPQLGQIYDFKLEEEAETGTLIQQITAILLGEEASGVLFDLTKQRELCKEQRLPEQGVVSGHTLLLLIQKEVKS